MRSSCAVRWRRALGIDVGDEIVMRLEGDDLSTFTRRKAIQDAQALIRRYVPAGRSLVDELIEERRRETE